MTIAKGRLIYNAIVFRMSENRQSSRDLVNHLYVIIRNATLWVITWVLEAHAFFGQRCSKFGDLAIKHPYKYLLAVCT
ncbi:MAG: hypothetical protein ABSB81_03070 [Halobacteriota archaeon]|jgi:hypothetical protein